MMMPALPSALSATVTAITSGVAYVVPETMGFSDWLSTAAGIMAIATLAGLALVRGDRQNLREQRDDALKDASEEHRRNEVLGQQVSQMRQAMTELQSDYDALSKVVTGEVHWTALGDQVSHLTTMQGAASQRQEQLLIAILAALQGRVPAELTPETPEKP